MNFKRLFLFLVVLCCFSSFVFAGGSFPPLANESINTFFDDLLFYYSFDNDTVSDVTIDDLSGNSNDGTKVSATEPVQRGGGISEDSVYFDGSNDRVSTGVRLFGSSNEFTFNLWFKDSTADFGNMIWQSTGALSIPAIQMDASGDVVFYAQSGGCGNLGSNYANNIWHMATGVCSSSSNNCSLYVDGSYLCSFVFGSDQFDSSNILIGGRVGGDANAHYQGLLDEVGIWNRSLSSIEVANLYEAKSINNYSNSSISVSNPLGVSNYDLYNTDYWLNFTVNSTADFECYLYLVEPIEFITMITGAVNESAGTDVSINVSVDTTSLAGSEAYGNITIQCFNGIDYARSDFWIIGFDDQSPTITTDFTNQSLNLYENLTGQFNLSDGLMLHRFNISIDGVEIDSETFNNSIDKFTGINVTNATSFYSYNLSYYTENLTVGTHNFLFEVWDGHTAEDLLSPEAYNPKTPLFKQYLEYDFDQPYKEGKIRMEKEDSSYFDEWDWEVKKDRYSEILKPSNPSSTQSIILEAENYIYVVGHESGKYGGVWLIIDDHWKDFVLENESNAEITIERISDKKVKAIITGITNTEELRFSSTGDLNYAYANFTFNITYQPILNVSVFDINGNVINNFTATAVSYNSSNTSSSTTTTGSTLMELEWETYLVSVDIPEYALYNYQQNITMDNLSEYLNFTLYPTNTLNITFKFEENLTIFDTEAISLNLISDSYSNNFSTSNGTIFLSGLIAEEYLITYSSPSYALRSYFFNLVDRTYNELILYVSDNYDNITAYVYDQGGTVVEGATIEVLKYDVATNSYFLTEQVVTNFQGRALLMHLQKNDVFYKFRVRYDGELKPIYPSLNTITNPTYIYSDSISLQINLEDIILEDFFIVADISGNLSFNDATNNFKFEFSDNNGLTTKACMYVTSSKNLLQSSYNSSCVWASAGTILIPVEVINGTTYKATVYVYPSGVETFFDNLMKTFLSFNDTGKFGLFLMVLLTITFAFISLRSPITSIIMTPLPLLFASLVGFVNPSLIPVMIGIEIAGIVLVIFLKDKL